jgi:hypothetical protein
VGLPSLLCGCGCGCFSYFPVTYAGDPPLPFIGKEMIWRVHVLAQIKEEREKQKVFRRVHRLPVYPSAQPTLLNKDIMVVWSWPF